MASSTMYRRSHRAPAPFRIAYGDTCDTDLVMAFYLRKSFRMGPVRFNLSKSGLGASIGVKGARIGITSTGRAYVHAGRGGVYVRQYLGGSTGTSSPRASGFSSTLAAEPVTLFEDTGATYAPPATVRDRATLSRLEVGPTRPAVWPYVLLVIGGLVFVAAALGDGGVANPGIFGLGLALTLSGSFPLRRAWLRDRARDALRRAIEPAVAAGRAFTDDELAAVRQALGDPNLTPAARRAVLERGYLDAARKIVVDGFVTPDELRLLEQFETELGADAGFCRQARADAFRCVYLRAVADHELTPEEEAELEHVREALRVPAGDVAFELDVLDRLAGIRRIRDGELPIVQPSVPLPRRETCHFEGPGRLLKEKNLRTFQRDGVRYRVRGFTIDKEGTLFVTDRRVLLVHAGTTSIPMDQILDVEVDTDHNVVRITRDGARTPVLLTTPDALLAGAIIAAVRGV